MNKLNLALVLSALCTLLSAAAEPQFDFKSYRSRIVIDTVPGAVAASGIVVNKKGEWVTTFGNRGDVGPGCTVFFIKSTDQGETWSKPYKTMVPEKDNVGLVFNMYQLPDGNILGIKSHFEYVNNELSSAINLRGFSVSTVMLSTDGGETFTELQKLKTPKHSIVALMNSLTVLKNGDLLLPAWVAMTRGGNFSEFPYGSGFFRSKDGGRTWGDFELAFKEVPGRKRTGYNESVFVQKDDGTIVGFARVDTTMTKNMWKIISKDDGKTWSMPVETAIPGQWPEVKRLKNGVFLMVCGYFKRGTSRKTTFYLSTDGENYTRVGNFKYSRPIDNPQNGFGGGTHSIMPVSDDSAYVMTFGWDFDLTYGGWYLDGCMVEAKEKK